MNNVKVTTIEMKQNKNLTLALSNVPTSVPTKTLRGDPDVIPSGLPP